MLMDSRFQFGTRLLLDGNQQSSTSYSLEFYAMTHSVYLIVREEVTRDALREVLCSVGIDPIIVGRDLAEIRRKSACNSNGRSLAVIDVGLPNGWDFKLYNELQALRPNMKVLVTTSYDKQEIDQLYPQKVPFSVLYKPYGAQAFISVVRSILKH